MTTLKEQFKNYINQLQERSQAQQYTANNLYMQGNLVESLYYEGRIDQTREIVEFLKDFIDYI